jgi:hypothetical protein
MRKLVENYERYFGKIFADLIKRLVEEDESKTFHEDRHRSHQSAVQFGTGFAKTA